MEGKLAEQSFAIQDLKAGQRETDQNWQAGLRETNQNWQAGLRETNQNWQAGLRETNQGLRETNARIDRLFLALLGIGGAQIGLLITLIVRST